MNRSAQILLARGYNDENGPECPYCKENAILSDAFMVYGRFGLGNIWLCRNYPACNSFVGVHKRPPWRNFPLGSMANEELRELRKSAHDHFDKLWKEGNMTRKEAYTWLQNITGLEPDDAHIGEFNNRQCEMLIELCKQWK